VHPMHPAMAEASARARVAELRGRRPSARKRLPSRRHSRSIRSAIGWFLVNLGMRLALPQPSAVRTATR
jgi:hypothetical protein